jgi:CrcB protein
MPILLQIALGGAIGAVLRYLVGGQVLRLTGGGFPWGTLTVNVAGCFAMGLALMVLTRRGDESMAVAPFVMTGLLGGFTTFSAFSLEVFDLAERGRPLLALGYVAASVVFGLGAFVAGASMLRGGGAP